MMLPTLLSRISAAKKRIGELPEGSQERADEESRLSSYLDIWNWFKRHTDTWAKRRGTAGRVYSALRYGYEKTAAMPEFNTTPDSVKASLFQADQRIQKLIGFDVIKQIDTGNTRDAMRLFYLRVEGKTGVRELFPADLVGYLPTDDKWIIRKVTKKSIVETLNILRSISVTYLANTLLDADEDALLTILYTLSYNSDAPAMITLQTLYLRYLKLEIDLAELTERLKEFK